MEDWDNPAYPFTIFELHGGVHVRRLPVKDGEAVAFVVDGREVACPMRPDDCQLPDGTRLSYAGTWFWQIECEFTPLPYGPYPTRWEAEDGARGIIVDLMNSDREALSTLFATRH
jgi:hypothetical protein